MRAHSFVGFAGDKSISGIDSVPVLIRFGESCIDAINGDEYAAIENVEYKPYEKYKIYVEINLKDSFL